ncbi:SH3 domain-binding protein 5 [Sciurus carolinensis]|uniref:SH3 domain-binding protein 5 n=1 Tax=Sciurus carolinensis TaxID=30640 RepID=A0AA41T5D8_SCICA|nr:SH3 domain-binding protein 5 [Sciurus carolinensis]
MLSCGEEAPAESTMPATPPRLHATEGWLSSGWESRLQHVQAALKDMMLKWGLWEEPVEFLPIPWDLEEEEEERMEQSLKEEEELDQWIQGELEEFNQSTGDIKRQETELEDDGQKFCSLLVEAMVKLDELVKKIGTAVRQAQLEAQKATPDFQRATEVIPAVKETIFLAQQWLLEDDKHQLEKKLKRAINKSKLVELKEKYYGQLEQLKKLVDDLQAKLTLVKCEYNTALKNLEGISEEILQQCSSIVGL